MKLFPLALLALAACGGPELDDSAETEADATARYAYTCYGYGAAHGSTMSLTVAGDHATYKGQTSTGALVRDPAYKPRKYPDRQKLDWTKGGPDGTGRSPYMLVQETLRAGGTVLSDGKKGGFAGVYYQGDWSGQLLDFVCKR